MIFKEELIKDVLEEAKPMLQKHWQEVSHYKDIPFDPNYNEYLKLEELGNTRTFCARRQEDGMLIGYAVFFVRSHIHYRSMMLAQADIIYVDPDFRGVGPAFIQWMDDQLAMEKITVVSHHLKAKLNLGRLMERLGYEIMDHVYVKRLN